MAVQAVKLTGAQAMVASHTAGSDIYVRSSLAADEGIFTLYGIDTAGPVAAKGTISRSASEGLIEIGVDSAGWDELHYVRDSIAPTGTVSVFSADGTAATGNIHVHDYTQINDGDTIEIGPVGFTTVGVFKTTPVTSNQIKIQANNADMAEAIASWISDAVVGSMVDGTDWINAGTSPAAANLYVSAAMNGTTDIDLTDKIACKRQVGWVLTTDVGGGGLSLSSMRGGIDGTLLGTIAAGTTTLSTSLTSGVDLDDPALTANTLPDACTETFDSIRTRGKFCLHIRLSADPTVSIIAKIQRSSDNTNWTDATTAITDLNTDWDQIVTGDDLFAEWMRLVITTHAGSTGTVCDAQVYYQG